MATGDPLWQGPAREHRREQLRLAGDPELEPCHRPRRRRRCLSANPMILTVFRSRLRDEARAEYFDLAAEMAALAQTMPGFRSRKTFVAEDGERVIIVEFEDEASQRAWSTHPRHVDAKRKGRQDFYSEYSLQVCEVIRESRHPR
jgi:heme-degrading monooxygenase HmoA